MIVTFCGHRQMILTEEISNWLDIILPSLIEGGATTFCLGGYGKFDQLAAAAVRRQKIFYPNIRMFLVLAYPDRAPAFVRRNYDGIIYPLVEKVPFWYAMERRDAWIVDVSDVLISGVMYDWSDEAKMLRLAKSRKSMMILQFPRYWIE